MSVKSFTLYKEFNDLIKLLKDEDKEAKVVYAIWKYMFEDKYIVLDKEQQAIFDNLKRPLDKIKIKSKNKLNKIKIKSKNKLNKIKIKSKLNQKENEKESHQDVNVNVNDNVYVNNNKLLEKENKKEKEKNLIEFMEDNGFTLYPVDYELVNLWDDTDLTRYAIKQAVLNKKFSTKYVDKILSAYKSKGITSISDAMRDDEEFSESKKHKADTPNWLDKEIKEEPLTEKEEQELKAVLQEFQ